MAVNEIEPPKCLTNQDHSIPGNRKVSVNAGTGKEGKIPLERLRDESVNNHDGRNSYITVLTHAFAIKEAAIKKALVDQFSDDETVIAHIEKGFKAGAGAWQEYLSAVVGKDQAKRIMEEIRQIEVRSSRL
jgi:hypothetical protein